MNNLIEEFKEDFRKQYSFVYFEDYVSDKQIGEYIEENIDEPYQRMINDFSDWVMSQGLCDVQE
jgi:hypothetical protein